jgi:UDP-N-acetylmuramoyl-tripeptide--D-alanyl-D-alanine ligase
MIEMTLGEIAEAVGGRLHNSDGSERVTATVEFDSRKLTEGGLFVAVPGERVDGHTFAAAAVDAGAVGVLAGHEVDAPAVIAPAVSTADAGVYALAGDADGSGAAVLAAFGRLANHVVTRLSADGLVTVAVTGSAGKTSTKDLIGQLLERVGKTVTPPGSFNAELGLPWTVLRADRDTKFLVLEMAARGVGHIAALCKIAPPGIGAVLNVGTSHLDEFGSPQAVAQAKGELVEALPAQGIAVLNLDDTLVSGMSARTPATVVGFGEAGAADVRAVDVDTDEQARPRFTLLTRQGKRDITLKLHGVHQVSNALAATAVAMAAGADLDTVATGLADATPLSGKRMEVTTRDDDVMIINDAYNASPEAVRLALKSLAHIARSGSPRRRAWAVLGPMLELGDDAKTIHDEIGRLAVRLDISRLVVVGEQARPMHSGANLEGSWGDESVLVPDVDAAITLLRAELRPHDVVLIKAANSFRFWRIAEQLLGDRPGTTGGR